ncbi:MAG: bifunctional nuclease family protein, partial [Candidatus Aenigmarchaeota archaeon]|nr:bifunctional nuclease family protein [Candidatus Aenigmarchaeota archaeon]
MKKHTHVHRAKAPFVRVLIALLFIAGIAAAIEIMDFFPQAGFVEANVIDVEGTTITMGRDCTAIVAETTADQARSIRLGKEKRIDVRPTTHDLYVETLRSFNITVENAAVVRFDSDVYYGELVLRSADRVLRLDSRPTDAIAVALRAGVPIMLNRTMLEQQG